MEDDRDYEQEADDARGEKNELLARQVLTRTGREMGLGSNQKQIMGRWGRMTADKVRRIDSRYGGRR